MGEHYESVPKHFRKPVHQAAAEKDPRVLRQSPAPTSPFHVDQDLERGAALLRDDRIAQHKESGIGAGG